MGAIRGVLLVFVCVILFLSLLVGNILLTLSSSLKYDNIKPELVSLIKDIVNEQLTIEEHLNQLLPAIELYCQVNQQYTFAYGGNIFTIPCSVSTQGSDAVVKYGVNSLVGQYYYAEYDCDFWDCFGEEKTPLFLISEKAHNYWKNKFYFSLLLSIALAGLVLLLVEKKTNFFLLVGSLTIISSLPLIKLEKIPSLFPNFLGNFGEYLSEIVAVFFNQSHNIFIKVLIIGCILVAAGIVLKLFHLGFAISNFFSKFQKKGKETVQKKKEISIKDKKKKQKSK